MTSRIHRLITMHCTNHIERGEADAVWGAALCDRSDSQFESYWHIISFDGRRGKAIAIRPKDYGSEISATSAFESKIAQKTREGYRPVEWINPYYGLVSTIREIDPDFFDVVTTESTRVGMDTSSSFWKALSGESGDTILDLQLIYNLGSSNQSPDQSRTDSAQEQTAASGRSGSFAPDPKIGNHVFLWDGPSKDANFMRCGVCSNRLSKHQRLVVNYRGRLARHIWRQGEWSWLCRHCNLPRDGAQGRSVHSAFENEVEFINAGETLREQQEFLVATNFRSDEPSFPPGDNGTVYSGGLIPIQPRPDNIRPIIKKPGPLPRPEKKTEPETHERIGGLLDFDI